MPLSRSLAGVGFALVTASAVVRAQDSAPASAKDTTPSYGQIISVSPLFALLGFYTADIERRVTSSATLGAGGSAFTLGPFGYKSLDLKARLYPGGHALQGLGVGVSAGVIRLSADAGGLFSSRSSGSGIVVGTDGTFTRVAGKRHGLAFSIGGGFKRILRFGGYDVSGVHLTYPTARASIGLAF